MVNTTSSRPSQSTSTQGGSNCISQLAMRCLGGLRGLQSTASTTRGNRSISEGGGGGLLDRSASSTPTTSTRRNQMTERPYAPPLQVAAVAPKGSEEKNESSFESLISSKEACNGPGHEISVCAVCSDELADLRAPCGHFACESCWRAWLSDHDGCWLCQKQVTKLARVKGMQDSDVSRGGSAEFGGARVDSTNGIAITTTELRQASTLLIKGLVALKHRTMEVSGSLCEVEEHLRALASPGSHQFGQGADAWTAVLAVERRVLANTALAVLALSTGKAGSSDALATSMHDEASEKQRQKDAQVWLDLETAVGRTADQAQAALRVLDEYDDNEDTNEEKRKKLIYARSTVNALGVLDVAAAQWSAARTELETCLSDRLSRLKPLLCGAMDHLSAESAMTAALFGLPVEPGIHLRHHRRRSSQPHIFRDPRNLDRALRSATSRIEQLDSMLDTRVFQATQLLAARIESYFPEGASSYLDDDDEHRTQIATTSVPNDDDENSSGTAPLLHAVVEDKEQTATFLSQLAPSSGHEKKKVVCCDIDDEEKDPIISTFD